MILRLTQNAPTPNVPADRLTFNPVSPPVALNDPLRRILPITYP